MSRPGLLPERPIATTRDGKITGTQLFPSQRGGAGTWAGGSVPWIIGGVDVHEADWADRSYLCDVFTRSRPVKVRCLAG